ncbi:MAG: response regulator [Deltaproteobacteria bacterium]|nr:response regulator [Deltaproteobacteria bacterium]
MPAILVVEDSPAMRAFVRASLEPIESCDVALAENGFEALRVLPRRRYDLIVTDINMPDINGLELIRFVRQSESHRDVPIVIISTDASPRDRERAIALGATDYLVKPFSADDLRAVVEKRLLGARAGLEGLP